MHVCICDYLACVAETRSAVLESCWQRLCSFKQRQRKRQQLKRSQLQKNNNKKQSKSSGKKVLCSWQAQQKVQETKKIQIKIKTTFK